MDDRQRQLIAAAEQLRTWVLAQKAGWNGLVVAQTVPALHMPAQVAVADATADLLDPIAPLDQSAPDESAATPSIALPSIDVAARVGGMARWLSDVWHRTRPVVARSWRPAIAAVAVMALVGFARASWPAWSRGVKAQLAAAGQHVSVFDRPQPKPEPVAAVEKPAPAGRRVGSLHVQSNPSGAHVVLDGKDRGVTPLVLNEISTGTHSIVLNSTAGSVQRSISVAADKTTQVNEAIFSGWVHVSSSLELELSEAGHGLRMDDSNQLLLPPGLHELRFENKRFAFVETRKVDVRPGDTTSIEVEPPASKLSVSATTPAEVLVDGTLVGGTPLTDYAIQVGTREIVVRNAAGVERRSVVTVTLEGLKLDIDFN